MHGSRRRMHTQLTRLPSLRGRFLACTVDSLARHIVGRWRTMASVIDPLFDACASVDFEKVCHLAALLMDRDVVASWIKARYPVAVVDELQDCRGDRLGIIQAIESCCHVIAAADDFQDLQTQGPNPAVEWLHAGTGKKNLLSGNRRTKQQALLIAAGRLRSSQDCGDILKGMLMAALNKNAAAGHAARTLYWKKAKGAVILTPTGPQKSKFARDVVARLSSSSIKPKGITSEVGPFRVIWECGVEEERVDLVSKLGDVTQGCGLQQLRATCSGDTGALGDLLHWAERKCRVKGQVQFSTSEIATGVDRILNCRRAFLSTASPGRILAMTINQAKNREFEGVIILWPFEVGGTLESQRRRLYNALTRAQQWAVVIVQDEPKKDSRLSKPPFSKPQKSSS